MTIENLKQIAIKYATTKGSRVPLAPDELCNAVVQYFNEFLKITADINTIQVAVTEEGGNIVFTITGNTLDGKAFTPIVITVDHNDFVTNQEFEEFKTSVTKQLNNKRSVISSPASSYVVYTQANGLESNLPYSELANQTSTNIMARRANGTSDVKKGISGENVANMENIADVEAKIPAYTTVDSVSYDTTNGAIIAYDGAHEIHIPLQAGENVTIYASEDNKKIVISAAGGGGAGDVTAAGNNTFTGENTFTNEITFNTMKSEAGGIQFGNFEGITEDGYNYSSLNDYQFIMQKFVGTDDYYETLINADLITYKPAGDNNVYEFHFPNKSGIFALTSDVPNSGSLPKLGEDNTYTGTNYFKGETAIKSDLIIENAHITNRGYGWDFPLKSGTVALTTDIPSNKFYFISFSMRDTSVPEWFNGIIITKNSYGSGQMAESDFAHMLNENGYTDEMNTLAANGIIVTERFVTAIYSDDDSTITFIQDDNSIIKYTGKDIDITEVEL